MDKIDGDATFCFRFDEQETLDALIGINSVVCDGGTNRQARGDRGSSANATTDAEALAAVTAGSNVNLAFTITLTGTVINGTGEAGVTPFAASGRSTFFPDRTYVGAMENAAQLNRPSATGPAIRRSSTSAAAPVPAPRCRSTPTPDRADRIEGGAAFCARLPLSFCPVQRPALSRPIHEGVSHYVDRHAPGRAAASHHVAHSSRESFVPSPLIRQLSRPAQDALTADVEDASPEEEFDQPDISIPGGGIIVTGRRGRNPERVKPGAQRPASKPTSPAPAKATLPAHSAASASSAGRQWPRVRARPWRPLLAGAAQRPAAAQPGTAQPGGSARHLSHQRGLLQPCARRPYYGQLPGRIRAGCAPSTSPRPCRPRTSSPSASAAAGIATTFENSLTYFGSLLGDRPASTMATASPSTAPCLVYRQRRPLLKRSIGDLYNKDISRAYIAQQCPSPAAETAIHPPINFSANITGGKSFDLGGDAYLGVIATAGISNNWRNRPVLSQERAAPISAARCLENQHHLHHR